MKIDEIGVKLQATSADSSKQSKKTDDAFSDILKKSLDEVNKLQDKADDSIKGIASGKMDNIQDAVMAIEKADISMKLLTEIRNKAIKAYEEIMRMQV
jgi:flagellar hook-basal body complex protein FliE